MTPVLQIPNHVILRPFQCPFLGNKGQRPQGGAIKPLELVLDGREGIWGKSKEAPVWVMLRILSEKAMALHSSTLAWKIPWMEEPGGLQSTGLLRIGHD